MSDISYIKGFDSASIVGLANQYGSTAFVGDGMTETQKLEKLCAAIQDLSGKLTNFELFFTTRTADARNYEKIIYHVDDFNKDILYVRVIKTIIVTPRNEHETEAKIEESCLFLREAAQGVVDALNAAVNLVVDGHILDRGHNIYSESTGNWTVISTDRQMKRVKAKSEKYGESILMISHIGWRDRKGWYLSQTSLR